jgi:hypothetical protein
MTTATAGTGTITLGSAVAGYLTFAEAGVANADTVSYVIIDGNDFEIGTGTYTSSGTTMSRDTVIVSKIGGVAGTTKITLSGTAEVFLSPNEADLAFTDVNNVFTKSQTFNSAAKIELGLIYSAETLYIGVDTGQTYAYAEGSNPFVLYTGTAERARWDATGQRLYSVDAGATPGPILELYRDSASPAASDVLGRLLFSGEDSAGNTQNYAAIEAVITDATSTSEDGDLAFHVTSAGSLTERVRLASFGGIGIGGANYGSAGDCLVSGGSAAAPSWQASPLRGHIWGLTLSNNGTDSANDIDVAAGAATDESHSYVMVLAASITKRLDAAWAVGTGQGGLNTGVEANSTWYEVHLIRRPDTGVVDVMFTTTANRATLPSGYTQQRRIGWIRNDSGGSILAFTQVDDHFTLTTQINDVAATITSSAAAVTLTVPPSTIARFRATAQITALTAGAVTGVVFSEIAEGNVTPALTTGILSLGMSEGDGTGTANDSGTAGHFELRASSSSQIEWDGIVGAGSTGEVFDISTYGWIDSRRRLSAI